MYPPTEPPLDPLGLPPAPSAPAAPAPVQPASMPTGARVILTALAALAGPGRGTGLLQGMQLADQTARQRAMQDNTLAQQDYQRQHLAFQDEQRAYQAQQEQRAARLKQMLDSFQTELASTPDDTSAENLYTAAGQAFQSMGFRGFDVDSLKRKYKSPSMVERATKTFNVWSQNAGVAKALKDNPASLLDHTIGNVGGVPMTFGEYAKLKNDVFLPPQPKEKPAPTRPEWVQMPDGSVKDINNLAPPGSKPYDAVANRPERSGGASPRDRFSVQQVTKADGTTALMRVNLDTNQAEEIGLPAGVSGAGRPNEKNQASADFLGRAYAADSDASSFEQQLSALGKQMDVQLPNLLKSKQGQLYRNAQDEFINAGLRDESGAAIAPSEYDRYRAIYFAVPGDQPETIARKQQARARIIKGLRSKAGNLAAGSNQPAKRRKVYDATGKLIREE